jgi:hypothetical protein
LRCGGEGFGALLGDRRLSRRGGTAGGQGSLRSVEFLLQLQHPRLGFVAAAAQRRQRRLQLLLLRLRRRQASFQGGRRLFVGSGGLVLGHSRERLGRGQLFAKASGGL